ncbi:hypothetical protein ANCDUO_05028 [Ancylostoma duodenale]|uniref:Uncharacterized protein n=1 Tax=Ancylostoma duodenale TaxID=51022 RepID=A0A0C2DPR9_9BILA|nr:hypothetical protein ANCDUO_05028 [Ancylostoma duodenale]
MTHRPSKEHVETNRARRSARTRPKAVKRVRRPMCPAAQKEISLNEFLPSEQAFDSLLGFSQSITPS